MRLCFIRGMVMSVSFASRVAVGVRLGKVWEIRTITEQVKKFNPDTGEPYMAEASKKVTYFCDKPTDFYPNPQDHESDIDLDVCVDDSEGEMNKWILGKKVYSVNNNDNGSIVEIKSEDIEKAKKEVAEKLMKHGYTGEIGVYLIAYVSY